MTEPRRTPQAGLLRRLSRRRRTCPGGAEPGSSFVSTAGSECQLRAPAARALHATARHAHRGAVRRAARHAARIPSAAGRARLRERARDGHRPAVGRAARIERRAARRSTRPPSTTTHAASRTPRCCSRSRSRRRAPRTARGLLRPVGRHRELAARPGLGALLAGALQRARRRARAAASHCFVRGARVRVGLALGLPLGCIALSVLRFYTSPMVHAYDPFVGFFSGTLYDTVVELLASALTDSEPPPRSARCSWRPSW
jgi:hypothetical protein